MILLNLTFDGSQSLSLTDSIAPSLPQQKSSSETQLGILHDQTPFLYPVISIA